LHFVAIGAALFVLHRGLTPEESRIWISRAHVEGLRQDHLRQTGLLPTPEQEAALIERFVEDEVLLREALRMGLDQGDPIVRRRLIQRMDFLVGDLNPVAEPTRADLMAYFENQRERFARQTRISLTHVFLNRNGSAEPGPLKIQSMLDALSAGVDPKQLGDPFALGVRFVEKTPGDLAAIFGSGFAEALNDLEEGVWGGPIESSYGSHLVLVTARKEAREPDFEEVRPLILAELRSQRREERTRAAIRNLSDRYEIRLEGPNPENEAVVLRMEDSASM
jgi:hypothetical protein